MPEKHPLSQRKRVSRNGAKNLPEESATSPFERLMWLTRAVRFAWEAADPATKRIYEMECRGKINNSDQWRVDSD